MANRPKHVYLCGFMGSGKTTVGRLLAERMQYRFVDTDEEIEKRSGSTIPDLFEQSGEAGFRRMEKTLIRQIAEEQEPAVIALGGGSLMDEDSLRIVKSTGLLIYLQCSEGILMKRLCASPRPLLKTNSFQELLNQRIRGYRQADRTIQNDLCSPKETVHSIEEWLSTVTDSA